MPIVQTLVGAAVAAAFSYLGMYCGTRWQEDQKKGIQSDEVKRIFYQYSSDTINNDIDELIAAEKIIESGDDSNLPLGVYFTGHHAMVSPINDMLQNLEKDEMAVVSSVIQTEGQLIELRRKLTDRAENVITAIVEKEKTVAEVYSKVFEDNNRAYAKMLRWHILLTYQALVLLESDSFTYSDKSKKTHIEMLKEWDSIIKNDRRITDWKAYKPVRPRIAVDKSADA